MYHAHFETHLHASCVHTRHGHARTCSSDNCSRIPSQYKLYHQHPCDDHDDGQALLRSQRPDQGPQWEQWAQRLRGQGSTWWKTWSIGVDALLFSLNDDCWLTDAYSRSGTLIYSYTVDRQSFLSTHGLHFLAFWFLSVMRKRGRAFPVCVKSQIRPTHSFSRREIQLYADKSYVRGWMHGGKSNVW